MKLLRLLPLLLLALLFTLPAYAGETKDGPGLELTTADTRDLDGILEESKAVDIDTENARLRTIAAANRADKVRAQYELVRLRILTSRKLDPAAFDVVYEPVERNGVKANEWIIKPRPAPSPTGPRP